ncbi:peptide transporter [Ancrocorticia populi]|uniref:Peptide transporter n=2 Tax=Ancrocorticia populi TaxID=2175228 RepID=A0A2V1KAM9_9ACTO|nr:peptide transporter [Ancrocorticia populi]
MKKVYSLVAVGAAATLVLSACSSSDNSSGKTEVTETSDRPISFTVAQDEFDGYNTFKASTYSTWNTAITDRMMPGFGWFDTEGVWQHGTDLGDYEEISEDPLTIKYTISDDAVYQGGTPITCEDFYMDWVAQNPEWIRDGLEESGSDSASLFDHVSGPETYANAVPEGPQCEAGDKEFTIEYNAPNPDWELVVTGVLPSHVIADKLDMTKEELFQAFKDEDFDVAQEAAEAWNGWTSEAGEVPSPDEAPSWGPYTLKEGGWKAGEYVTLEPNPDWWGEPAGTTELVVKQISPEAMLQALNNEDVNVIEPQATQDTLDQLEAMDGVVTSEGSTLIWEHLDMNQGGSSIFAEDEGGLALREAFAYCVPRQDIVDKLIKPLNPDAEVMNAREYFPTDEDYADVVEASYDGRYDEVDIDKAKEKVEESGIDNPTIRIGYSGPNQRRTDQVSLIQASCADAGITIEDVGSAEFMADGGNWSNGDFDVALFAWSGSGQIVSGQNIYASNGNQNMLSYANDTVDEEWQKVNQSLDPEVWLSSKKIIEKELWDDLYGIPLFAHPGIIAYTDGLQNVEQTVVQTGVSWNAEQWTW